MDEAHELGDGKGPCPDAQLDAIERASAAIYRFHGWNEWSVIGHLQWTNQKVDPRGFTMDAMRDRIRKRLAQNPDSGGANPTTHRVKPGETLTWIGRDYGVSWKDIAATNGIRSPYRIFPAAELVIPGAAHGSIVI